MSQRIKTAVICLIIFIPILIFADTIVFNAAIALLSAVAMFEAVRTVGGKSKNIYMPFAMIFAAVLPFLVLLKNYEKCLIIAVISYSMIIFVIYLLTYKKSDFKETAAIYFISFYVALLFLTLLLTARSEIGKLGLYFVFIGAWVTDTFAYFSGVLFGKHKLCPEISPKKTIEGSLGGTAFCMIAFVIYYLIIHSVFITRAGTTVLYQNNTALNCIIFAAFGIIISIVSQMGDLFASLVKRHYGIKDYGNIFPGHGGVLDRFDSVLFAAPVVYIFLTLFI